jgi:hypothetical protein
MTDKILERYTSRDNLNAANGNQVNDENEVEDLGTFGFLRGSRERATMLELRKKDGNILAVGYGWLEKIAFDPSEGITLYHAGQKILIKGRNLNVESVPKVKLFEGIARHRIPWIREAPRLDGLSASSVETVVDSIEW